MFDSEIVKCKKCRNILFNPEEYKLIINAHSSVSTKSKTDELCPTVLENKLLFLSEDALPEWIQSPIKEQSWAKGKLNCRHCDARIGAFDFISGIKCGCGQFVLPAVHVVNSKVDVIKSLQV